MTAKKPALRAVALAIGFLLLGAAAPFGGASGIAAQAVGTVPKSDPTLERAIAEQRKVVKRQSRSIDRATALNDLANLLELQGDIAAAFEHYREAIAADGSWAPAHFNLALLAYVNGDNELAASHLETAVELDPGNAWAHYQLGRIADDSDDSAAAVEHYVRAVSLDSHLAFSDVNPHFTVNRHATEILIRADRTRARALPPRAYSQPARISSLFLPEAVEELAEPQLDEAAARATQEVHAVETADGPDRTSGVGLEAAPEGALGNATPRMTSIADRTLAETGSAGAESPGVAANERSGNRRRVFTRDDLRTRTLGSGSAAGTSGGASPSARPGAGRPGVQPGTPIGPGGRQPQSSGSPADFGTPGGVRFQPSVRSSAQLETTIRRPTVPAP